MKAKNDSRSIIAAFLILLAGASLAEAFYDPSLGRWLNRDPWAERGFQAIHKGPSLPFVGDVNCYRFVSNTPININDYLGLASIPPGTCNSAPPLPNDSSECDKYGERMYLGSSLKCFCKCAPNDPWSQKVRGCLRCMEEKGYPDSDAHDYCYSLADQQFPNQKPTGKLYCCFSACYDWDGVTNVVP